MDDWDSFINSLVETDVEIPRKQSAEKRYPCGQCGGTGLYAGVRVHQEKKQCFACRGKGYFKTDPRKLEKARQQRAAKKQQALVSAQATNQANPVYAKVAEMSMWNDLASSMMQQHSLGKVWSEKQIAAIESMIQRMEQRRAEREAAATVVDLTPIVQMFEHAKSNGYKRPVYRAEGLKISLAPSEGNNAGALYVKTEDNLYIGKVASGKFFGTRDATEENKQALAIIAENPRDAAIRYGKRTGSCACCGRTLSNHASIELGIGPICAEKWFRS